MATVGIAALGISAAAATRAFQTYTYVSDHHKVVQVPISELDGVRMNDVCISEPDRCEALKHLKDPQKPDPRSKLRMETYAGDYCVSVGGTPLVLKTPQKGSAQFCAFKDLTMIDAAKLLMAYSTKYGGRP